MSERDENGICPEKFLATAQRATQCVIELWAQVIFTAAQKDKEPKSSWDLSIEGDMVQSEGKRGVDKSLITVAQSPSRSASEISRSKMVSTARRVASASALRELQRGRILEAICIISLDGLKITTVAEILSARIAASNWARQQLDVEGGGINGFEGALICHAK